METIKTLPNDGMGERPMIRITNGVARHPLWRMKEPINLEINRGEQVAIVGDNAAGKSRLVEVLTGHYPLLLNEVHYDFSPSRLRLASENMKYITFRDSYGEQDGSYYYQQRWNQHDIADDMPTAGALLQDFFHKADSSIGHELTAEEYEQEQLRRDALRKKLYDIFNLNALAPKRIISLSSGELRKFQLAKALGTNPRVLILDNPFIGLDTSTRNELRLLLNTLICETDLLVILILSKRADIPDFITHILPVEGLQLLPKVTREAYLNSIAHDKEEAESLQLPQQEACDDHTDICDSETLLHFRNVSIRYGERTILQPLDWTVCKGERWALSGPNGSGKSTLLSLVCADNPQAYACDIELFGHRRGSGESIWEIKRHIGYVSPEMHRAYLKDIPAIDVVASGLRDTVGLYVRPKPEQRQTCIDWMRMFGIESLADTSFLRLSSGEQRLCLLARAFVKNPSLLILDEPLHGLDDRNCSLVKQIIEQFCMRPKKTLIMVTHYEDELPRCITHRLTLKRS